MIPPSHIEALFRLLDDPEPIVRESVRARLRDIGPEAAPRLRATVDDNDGEAIAHAAIEALQLLGIDAFGRVFADVIRRAEGSEDIELEGGLLAVAFLGWPELVPEDVTQQLDTMASMMAERVRRCDNGYMVVREFNRYLIDVLGFRGCRPDHAEFYDPDNSCINRILERRFANPVGLAAVYLLIARRLHVPLFGVGFPSHFLLKYRSLGEEFFVDPFNGGQILSAVDCRRYLQDLDIEYRPSYLHAVNNRRIVARVMRNLADILRPTASLVSTELDAAIERLLDEESWGGRQTERHRPVS